MLDHLLTIAISEWIRQEHQESSFRLLTVCQTTDNDNCLKSSFLFIAPAVPLPQVIGTAADISVPSLPISLVGVQDTRYRRQHSETNPHLLLLLVANDFIFECP